MDFLKTPIKTEFKWGPLGKCQAIPGDNPPFADIKLVSTTKYVGIEVEVEQLQNYKIHNRDYWGMKEDGSLRNNGYEFVTYPVAGDQIKQAIYSLFVKDLPKDADFSERTSIHVHVNMRDALSNDLLNVMLLYITFERLLYKFAGPDRYNNIFCVPVQETKLPIALANYMTHHSVRSLIGDWQKYSGLNLAPLRNFGTVEYRQMQGHRDPVYLLNWINLLFRIHKYAKNNDFLMVFNHIKTLNSTSLYEQFVQQVFREDAVHLIGPNLKTDMENGVAVVKSITTPSPFLNELIEAITNESCLLKTLGISTTCVKKTNAQKQDHNEHMLMNEWRAQERAVFVGAEALRIQNNGELQWVNVEREPF